MSAVVYRIFDESDELLYIGSTDDLCRRIRGHFASRWSCSENAALRERFASVSSETYPTLAEAREAERLAIREEAPLLNKQHNVKRFRRGLRNSWVPVEQVTA